MGFYINGGEDVSLAGVTIRESGGDGITVASTIGKGSESSMSGLEEAFLIGRPVGEHAPRRVL